LRHNGERENHERERRRPHQRVCGIEQMVQLKGRGQRAGNSTAAGEHVRAIEAREKLEHARQHRDRGKRRRPERDPGSGLCPGERAVPVGDPQRERPRHEQGEAGAVKRE
jgi:hypothetical protein